MYQMFLKMYVKHYCDYFYHKLSICFCTIYNFLWIHMYEREEVMINVFLVGSIFLPNLKKRNKKGKKGKKVGVLPNIDVGKKFKTPKKGWKFIECSIYI